MKKHLIAFLLLTLVMVNHTETAFARSSKIQLFNGKNLDGWYTFIKGKGRNIDPNKQN
ncbi:MAG: hypothetical protein WCL21_17825 [Mariniphaga sp.]